MPIKYNDTPITPDTTEGFNLISIDADESTEVFSSHPRALALWLHVATGEVRYNFGAAATANHPTITGPLVLTGNSCPTHALHLWSEEGATVLVARAVNKFRHEEGG